MTPDVAQPAGSHVARFVRSSRTPQPPEAGNGCEIVPFLVRPGARRARAHAARTVGIGSAPACPDARPGGQSRSSLSDRHRARTEGSDRSIRGPLHDHRRSRRPVPRPSLRAEFTLVAQAHSAGIPDALRQILGTNAAPKLAQPIHAGELDTRLPLPDAVRVALLSRIGDEAYKRVSEQSLPEMLANQISILTGRGDKTTRLMDVATQSVQRREQISSATELRQSPQSLDALRHQADGFIRAQKALLQAR